MSSVAARFFKGCRSLLASVAGDTTKKPAPKTNTISETKPKTTTKSESPVQKKTPTTPMSTGIFKATPISPALSQFLGTSETTRSDAVKEIWTYIKSHDLQNPADKREILCDEKLKKIFGGKDTVRFLEIGKLLSPHFAKKTA